MLGTLAQSQGMNVSMVLPLRDQSGLTSVLGEIYDPSSPNYHHFLSVKEFADRFGPTADDYQKVLDFAASNGLEVHRTSASRMAVSLGGSVGQMEQAFNVKMRRYQHPTESREFFSADREPSVPHGLPIRHITGLNNYSLPMSMAQRLPAGSKSANVLGTGPAGNYEASDMRAAYYGGTALTGRGQTLGLVQFDGYNIADVISVFQGQATLGTSGGDPAVVYTPLGSQTTYTVPVHNVLLDSATGAPGQFQTPTDDAEQVLDIVQAIGMAPGLNQVRVYVGSHDVDILSAIADEKKANEVSISWAWAPEDPTSVDQFFQQMAAQGQSVFAASGDYGAYSPTVPYYFPAEDQWVTAVGGTHLTTNGAGGPLAVETAWKQSGGGVSPDSLPSPSWQAGIANSSNLASNTLRNVPDVAMEADFDNFNCNMGQCSEGWAGTSFASPRWAAFTALANEQALAAGDSVAGLLNPTIYATGLGASYGSEFHDTVLGETNYEAGYGFYAVPGYDLATGWGSPSGQNLIDALAPRAAVGFHLTTSKSGLTINPGDSAATTLGVIGTGSFSGNVSLAVTSTLPSGVTASFTGNPTSSTSVLTLTSSMLSVAQSFNVTVTGTSGALQATTYVAVDIPTNAVAILGPAVPAVPVTAEEIKPGVLVPIGGTILGSPQSVQLQWAPGINAASGWTSQGITQSAGLTPPFSNKTVGTWDTSSITVAGYYSIQLSAVYADGPVSATSLVYLEPDLLSSNWPQWLDTVPDVYLGSGIVPVDDGSGNAGLAFVEPTYLGETHPAPRYRVFSPDGSTDHSVALVYGSYPSPAFGHLTAGDAGTAIMGDSSALVSLDNDNTASSYPVGGANADFTLSQAVLADLNGDSTLATIAYGDQCWNNVAFIYAWDSHKHPLNSNFPIQVPCENGTAPFWNPGIAVGDIDGDGKQEIVALKLPTPTTFTFGLFAHDGTPRPWSAPTFDGMPERMILVDLDGNGKLELVVAVNPVNSNYFMLHVLQPDGTERNGWPVQMPGLTSLVAGDLARTGTEQIVVSASDKLFVFNGDGTPFSPAWPVTSNLFSLFGPVVLGDIDGDGFPEILVANGNYSSPDGAGLPATNPFSYLPSSPSTSALTMPAYLQAEASGSASASPYYDPIVQAFHRDGTVVRSWHIPGVHGEQPWQYASLAIGDFNHDGLTDIAIVDGLISGGGSSGAISEGTMEVLSTGSPYNPRANDWPMTNHDPYNSASAYPLTANSPQTKVPAFSLPSGTYPPPQTVSISDTTPGATIYYTTDGTTPTVSAMPYSGPITVSGTETIQAIATASGHSISAATSAAYAINPPAATPTFSVTPGTYTVAQTVAISDPTPNATIYYTTDGTTPTTGSTVYSGVITVGSTETLEAIAIATNYSQSIVASAAYTIIPLAATPTFSVTPGTYTVTQTVAISDSTPNATIYYTINGTTPTTGSSVYNGAITVGSTETLEAIAIASGYSRSGVASAAYVITPPAATPTFSVTPGTYSSAQTVAITDTTNGAVIYYTTDGTTPTTGSTLYSGPITVASSETIDAFATAPGYLPSSAASAAYIVDLANPAPTITSASPAFTVSDGPAFTLTIKGSGFISGSTVYWGNSALSTQFVNATQLTAQVPAANIASAGTTAIAVQTPTPGGGTSGALQFEVDSSSAGTSAAPIFATTTAAVAAGNTASYPVTFPSTVSAVTVTCLNLPVGASCAYSSSSGTVSIATSSATPAGSYQITTVFHETQTVAASYVLVPFLLLPLMFLRRKLFANGAWMTACLGLLLTMGAIAAAGCGGGGSATSQPVQSNPTTHQVTSSGVVTLTIK